MHREEPDIGAVLAGWVQCNILVIYMHSQSWGYMVVVATGADMP